jgi:hypothetical protein
VVYDEQRHCCEVRVPDDGSGLVVKM